MLTYFADSNNETQGIKTLDLTLDPLKEEQRANDVKKAKDDYDKEFGSMKKTREAISNLFEILWYSQLPCFDVKNITSQTKDEISLMKRCYWKEREISCSSIFRTRPTDRGMCCSFNMKKADDIFKESQYGEMINKMQKQDRDLGFDVDEEASSSTDFILDDLLRR